jgi:hypothetical protein
MGGDLYVTASFVVVIIIIIIVVVVVVVVVVFQGLGLLACSGSEFIF